MHRWTAKEFPVTRRPPRYRYPDDEPPVWRHALVLFSLLLLLLLITAGALISGYLVYRYVFVPLPYGDPES